METGIRVSANSVPYLPLLDHEEANVSDDDRLKQLGYKKELSRSLSYVINSFSPTTFYLYKSKSWKFFHQGNDRMLRNVRLWWCGVQGNSKLLGDILHRFRDHRTHNNVWYRIDLWWACYNDIWVAHCGHVNNVSGSGNGRDLLCLSYFWWPILLECQVVRQWVGSYGFLVHWLVSLS